MGSKITPETLVWPDDSHFKTFPKMLHEDCIEYSLFILDDALTSAALRSRLLEIKRSSEKYQRELLRGYIWHKESFALHLSDASSAEAKTSSTLEKNDSGQVASSDSRNEKGQEPNNVSKSLNRVPLHLHGRTLFGDSLADEWLIVYLLRETSRKFPELWIRVSDADGEFLLVEAANALPKWLNPEVAENRVWLRAEKIQVIPLKGKTKSANKDVGLGQDVSLSEALQYLSRRNETSSHNLLHDTKIDDEAFARLSHHPKAISSNLHTSIVTVPRKLAYLIDSHPSSVSSAVESFYLRDPIALKPLQSTSKDAQKTLTFPPEDLVDIPVTFQRVGFAQLKGQEFAMPAAWSRAISSFDTGKVDAGIRQSRRDTGMKLTCGFEMLLHDPQTQNHKVVQEMRLLLEDLTSGDDSLPTDNEIGKWHEQKTEDKEIWLDVNYEDLEKALSGQNSQPSTSKSSKVASTSKAPAKSEVKQVLSDHLAEENLRRMVQRFEDFIKDEEGGNIDGIDGSEDEMDDDDDDESNSEEASNTSVTDKTEFELTEAQLQEMIAEMKSMGLKPPAPSSDNDDEVRKALMALLDYKPPDIAKTKAKLAAETKAKSEMKSESLSSRASNLESEGAKPDGHVVEKKETAVDNPKSHHKPLWMNPDPPSSEDEDEEDVEEIPRTFPPPKHSEPSTRPQANTLMTKTSADEDELSDASSSDFDPFEDHTFRRPVTNLQDVKVEDSDDENEIVVHKPKSKGKERITSASSQRDIVKRWLGEG